MNLRKHEKEVRGRPMEKAGPQATEICAICGRPLTQRGPDWKCLRCLFNWGFLPEGEQSDQGSAGHRRVTAEPLKYAHFEVEVGADGFPVALGAGAMAITYRARDTVLNSVVALKVIDRKMAENPCTRSRFLREARAAAQIRHPNVARVTNYGEQDGECFYAMELVEGETLEARGWLYWHASLCQPGAVCRHRTNARRFTFRHLLTWRYALVSALRPNSVYRTHTRRSSSETSRSVAAGAAQGRARPRAGG